MPRGSKRSEIEILQADIAATQEKHAKFSQAASKEKQKLSTLQGKIDQAFAREIAKACRAAGIPLEAALKWVREQQEKAIEKDKAAAAEKPAAVQKPPAKKPSARKPAAKKTAARKVPAKKPTKPKASTAAKAKPVAEKAAEAPAETPTEKSDE